MSGRRSKRNQKLGSSRRGTKGLQVNEEKDNNEFDGQDEVHTSIQSDDTVLQAHSDHLPSLSIDNQTSVLESSPHAASPIHKDSDVEAELPERKRKIGSTRKKAGMSKSGRKLEPFEEFGEEQETQPTTSTMEEEHTYPTENKQRNASSDLSQQSQRSGLEEELGVAQNIMVHHQEISSHSQTTSLASYDVRSDVAIGQSTATKETLLSSTSQKRKMGSTRRPLGRNKEERNREDLEVQELLRNTTEDVWKAEVKSSSEAEFSMLEEMMQTWDDVKRKESPTNTSHAESDFISNQPLSSERAEELDVSADTNIQSDACLVADSTKPQPESDHETLFLNKETVYESGLETNNHNQDFDMCQDVTPSSPTRSENQAPGTVGGFSNAYQDESDLRHDAYTSDDCRSVTLEETKEELCRDEPKIISSSKQDIETDKLVVNVEEPLSSLCPLNEALKDDNYEISTDVPTAEFSRISDTHESNITHAEPTDSTPEMDNPEMDNPEPDSHGLADEKKEKLMESSTSGQEMKKEEESTQSKGLEENVNIQATDDFVEQEIQSEMQHEKTRMGLDEKHSTNETNVSDSSLCFANCDLANLSPVTGCLHIVNLNSLLPEDSKSSCDVMAETAVASFSEAKNVTENRVMKEENYIIETLVTCNVTVTEIVMDVENFTEQSVDLQTFTSRENETVGAETGPETDAFEIIHRENIKDNDNMMQIFKDEEENGDEEGDTTESEQQSTSQIQSSPSHNDPDKESYDFIQGASEENSEEIFLNAKSVCPAFDKEDETCEKYEAIEDFKESEEHEKIDASSVLLSDVTEPLVKIQDNDIRSDSQIVNHFSDINLEAFGASDAENILGVIESGLVLQGAVTESSQESNTVPEKTEISIIPEESHGELKKVRGSGMAEEFQEHKYVIDHNIKQTMMNLSDNEEHEMTETERRSTQELCNAAADKVVCHAEIASEQRQRSLIISQTQDDSENMLESKAEEMFLSANTEHAAFNRMNDTNDKSKEMEDFKEIEVAEDVTNVSSQDNDSQSDLQTENPEQNKVLTEKENYTSTDINLEEHDANVSVASSLSFGDVITDSEESHTKLENTSEIPEDSQKKRIQSKLNPLVHKRKMGSTRRGNKGQRKHREQDDASETLDSEKLITEEKPTEENICDITESQTTTNFNSESHENTGVVERVPVEGDTEAHLEVQTEIKMFDSTVIEERTEENICDDNVLMGQVEFVGDTVTEESIMIIKSDFLQNIPSTDTNQEALKSSENPECVSTVIDSGLFLQDASIESSLGSNTVPKITEISITAEDFQETDSHPNLSPVVHKRKMGSTRRPLRGNKGQTKHREQDDESETFDSENFITEEKPNEESICDITESQTTTNFNSESQENAGDVESVPVEGDTEAHLEVQTEIKMFDSTVNEERTEENICDDNVLIGHVELVEDTVTVGHKMTTESSFLQNNPSPDSNQKVLKSSENVEIVSDVTDTGLLLKDVVLVGSGEKTEMSSTSENSQRDSKLNPLAHKRKMGSTRRPLRGNKEKIKSAEEKEDGGREGVEEEDAVLHSETQDQNDVKDNIIQIIDEDKEHEITLNISQTQDGPQQDDSESMIKSEMGAEEEKNGETENTAANIEAIFSLKNINSEDTCSSQTHKQPLIQTTDEYVHDYIQTVKDVYEESEGEEILSANTEHAAFDSKNEKSDESKEIKDLRDMKITEDLTNMNIQDNDSQSGLQTENPEQNKVLTEEQNNTSPHINLQELQETEHAENVSAVIDSGLSFGDSEESYTKLENTSETSKDSQKEEKQSKFIPLVHKRKMGSTRRPLKGNNGQRNHREQDDEGEILKIKCLINEDKEEEKELSEKKNVGPVEELDLTLMTSSYNAETSTEESMSDITDSQTTTNLDSDSQKSTGDVECVPVEGDTEAHLEIQTEIKIFDSTVIEERTEENICDDNVLIGDKVTGKNNVTTESDFLQNNTSTDSNQEALKSPKKNAGSFSTVIDSGLFLQDASIESSLGSNTVPKITEISITAEDFQETDSHPNLSPVVHKRKMGSTRRPLRGNKGQTKHREQDNESETFDSEKLFTEEKPTEENICDITESQTITNFYSESHENAGDVDRVPVEGDTEAHLEIQTEIKMFDSRVTEERIEENICDDNVLIGDKVMGESNMTVESDFLQINRLPDANQEVLKSSENVESVSAVTDTGLLLKDVILVGSEEKTEMSSTSENFQRDSKLNPFAHKRKMGSTRRPLRGNKEKIKSAEEKEDGGSEGVEEDDAILHSDTQDQNNVKDNIIQIIDEDKEHETVRRSTQELCNDTTDTAEDHAEILSYQQQKPSLNISQTQDGPQQDDSENMIKSEMDAGEEKNTAANDEEIFSLEYTKTEDTVTSRTHQQLLIQTTDEDVHDYIQTVKDVHEESEGQEILSANTKHAAFDRMNEKSDESKEMGDFKEIEVAKDLTNISIQDNDSQSDLQTENPEQNKVLTEKENYTSTDINLEEHDANVSVASSLSFGDVITDSEESHTKLENTSEITEDSQKEKIQSKLNPLVHKRKMGSTRRGNKGQRKHREQDDESETLDSENLITEKKSTEETIWDITDSQTSTNFYSESHENTGDVERVPVEGDTEAHLEVQTEIKMFDSTVNEERTEENICDDNVLIGQVKLVEDTVTVGHKMTTESSFLQNNPSPDSNQEVLKSSENVEIVSDVTDTGLLLKDVVLVGSEEKTEMSSTSENSQRDSKLNPLAHKRKMGSTRRPLRGNKEKIKSAEEKEDGGREGVEEEDAVLHSETQDQNDVKDNIIQIIDEDKEQEITLNISQTQDGPQQDDSESMIKSEMDAGEEKNGETENTAANIEAIFSLKNINSEDTFSSQTHQQPLIQTTDEYVHDYIQTVKDLYEESKGEEILSANTEHAAFDSKNEKSDESKEIEDLRDTKIAEDLTNMNIQDNDSQPGLQTPHINLQELQETEDAENVSAVIDSGLSFGDSEESYTKLENTSETSKDSQKEEKQSKFIPLIHKRKMGSTRKPLRGNKGQRNHREQDDESETLRIEGLINEDKEEEKELSEKKNAGPVEELDSTLMTSSYNAEKPTEVIICDITESQTTTNFNSESHESTGDVERVPLEGDTEAHLEVQTEIKMFDSTVIEERTEENICDDNVLIGDKVTWESNMTVESTFLQNNPSSDVNQEGLKSENPECVSTVIDSGLVLQDVSIESSLESNTVPKITEMSIISGDIRGTESHPNLGPVVHKRKMGSTRRPLRGNKDKDDLRKVKEENMEPHIQEQNDVMDHNIIQHMINVRQHEDETSETMRILELCDPSENKNKEWHREITLEQEQQSSNTSQTQPRPSHDDAYKNLPEIQEKALEFKDSPFVLTDALLMEETQIHVSSEPAVTVGSPQTEDGKTHSVFSRSVNKRKMGSTRKTQRGQRMEKERELGEENDGETKNTPTSETFFLEEVMPLTITGTQVHQQPSSVALKGHDIENNISKLDNQTEKPEQTEMLVKEQNDPNSNTNQAQSQNEHQSEIIISHIENTQSKINPTVQKRKMGSTRKTLRGNERRRRDVESKEMDGGERISEEHPTEFATSERESKSKFNENEQFKDPKNTDPAGTSKILSEAEDGVTSESINNLNLSVVSEENLTKSEVLSEAFNTEALVSEGDLKVGEKDDPSPSETDKLYNLEVKSEHQVQLTVLDQSHMVIHSEKHPQSEAVTTEKRRKMGSTRKNFRGRVEEKKSEKRFAPGEDQDGETSIVQNAKRDSLEQSESSLLSEIERALNKTSQSSQNIKTLMINEPNLPNTPIEACHFNTPENSESEQGSDKEKYVSLQLTQSQNPSEISSPARRRKMGSTRKNPRQQEKIDDESKDDEEDEKNKQEPKSLKKDLEAAEESKVNDIRDQEGNKEYLDVPVSCQIEESVNSTSQERTSPSTKRKFGSRRTNIGKRDLDGLVPPESNDDITEDTSTQLVSLDQMIKASQHDRSPGKKQTADLKNISDMEVIQFNVVMVGNSCVGKTSFVRRTHEGQFSLDYCSTIGVDTCVQNVVLGDRVVKLQIWDTAGQERFHSITTQVFHRADGLLLMYEITSSKSFISVRDWITQVRNTKEDILKNGGNQTMAEKAPDNVIMMLLGNKSDCAGREVQVQEGDALAREYKMDFMECSAATGENVSECMKSLAEMLVQQKSRKMEGNMALKREQPKKKSGCC